MATLSIMSIFAVAGLLGNGGLTVVEGSTGSGNPRQVETIDVVNTLTSSQRDAARDVDDIIHGELGVALVQRSGVVWLLADGPVHDPARAVVYVAAGEDEELTDAQVQALDVLVPVLEAYFAERREPEVEASKPVRKPRATKGA